MILFDHQAVDPADYPKNEQNLNEAWVHSLTYSWGWTIQPTNHGIVSSMI